MGRLIPTGVGCFLFDFLVREGGVMTEFIPTVGMGRSRQRECQPTLGPTIERLTGRTTGWFRLRGLPVWAWNGAHKVNIFQSQLFSSSKLSEF
jgi:hypothetical protein